MFAPTALSIRRVHPKAKNYILENQDICRHIFQRAHRDRRRNAIRKTL
jgi:hypothetical protein